VVHGNRKQGVAKLRVQAAAALQAQALAIAVVYHLKLII
jgi:hypothetical protein